MPDDERKGRRLGDETKGRIADLASGWTVDSDSLPAPEPAIKREVTGPSRVPREATGPSRVAREVTGAGREVSGPSRVAREVTGPSREVSGPSRVAREVIGPSREVSGPSRVAREVTGPSREVTGRSRVAREVTGPSREVTGPNREVTGPSQRAREVTGPSQFAREVTGPSQRAREVTGPSQLAREVTGPSQLAREVTGPSRAAREVTGPSRLVRDTPRREVKPGPPPPPGSAARKSLDEQIAELVAGPPDDGDEDADATDGADEDADADYGNPDADGGAEDADADYGDADRGAKNAHAAGYRSAGADADADADEDDDVDADDEAGPGHDEEAGPGHEADVPALRPPASRPLTGRVPMGVSPRSEPSKPFGARSAAPAPSPPVLPAGRSPGPPPPPGRPRTSQVPLADQPRASRDGDALELRRVPEADKTKENRGAVGIKHDRSKPRDHSSLTTNAASGTIGGDTPPPLFDRAAIAAGQKGALASERVSPASGVRTTGSGPTAAVQGTPRPASLAGNLPLRPDASPPPAASATYRVARSPDPTPASADDSVQETIPERGAPDVAPRLAVPVGEFDHGQAIIEQDRLRVAYTQATIKRDAASALLGLAEPSSAGKKPPAGELMIQISAQNARGDATFNDFSGASTRRFDRGDRGPGEAAGEARGDPTLGNPRDDATSLSAPAASHAPAGTLRSSAALPRKRGLAGDIRYVATVVLGVREANRELAVLEAQQATRQKARRHHLVTLGRTAVTSDGTDHPSLGPARDQLSSVEDERSQHAGHVAAADTELTRVRRDREAKATQYVLDLAALDGELATFAKKLEPLEKEAGGIKKRAGDLHDAMRRIDGKIAATEASLSSLKGGKLDRAAVQAEIATLKADRRAIQSDEPVIAGQLDALNPRIAGLEAARGEAQRKRAELERAEQEDQRRVEELLTAIGAKRKVVDRAAADAEALRDKILFQLGERLYVDRPTDLTAQLAPVDEIDVELGVADRRAMELREIVSSIDKLKVARGIALIVLILGAIAALTVLIVTRFA